MRKRLACIIFLLVNVLAVICAINQDGHYKDSFEISAYKIGVGENTAEHFALYVVDSMYDSFLGLDSIESNNQIVINDKVHYLFDDLQNNPQPRTATFNADTMIFHVIAMGNRTGNYSLNLSFGSLQNAQGDVIDTAYTMGNARVNFENSESSISDNTGTYYAGDSSSWPAWGQFTKEKWNFSQRTLTPTEDFTDVISDTVGGNVLELKWMVYSSTMIEENPDYEWVWNGRYHERVDGYSYSLKQSDPSLSPLWISRAAVAMSIDKTEYDSSPEGKYKSEVIVTFTQK